jgi:GTPase SAR1 family protein
MNNVGTDRKKYKIVLVGDSLSGKSTLLTSFLYNRFNPDHDSVFRGNVSFKNNSNR